MRFIFLFYVSVFLISCKKTLSIPVQEEVSSDIDYFGLKKGNYIEYNVVHIIHDDEVDVHDTLKFKIKTLIGDTFTDNQGEKSSKFYRFTWNDINDTWKIKDVWSTRIEGKNAELVEENQRIIKLTFPIKLSTSWNATVLSIINPENYVYSMINKPLNISTYHFDSTLTVMQNKYYTLVDYKHQTETYARKIGMVSKYYKNLKIKHFDTLQVKKGEEWFYTLTKFGQE